MGRERPRPPRAKAGPRLASGVAHAPLSVSPCREKRVQMRAQIAARSQSRFVGKLGHNLPAILRVEYAVDLMVVLRCTQQLLVRLKQFDDLQPVESTTRLGAWYGNILRMGRRHALIFISERSRLPVLIPIREANRLQTVFPDAVCQMLAAVGVSTADIADERSKMSEMAFARTRSRSLLGTLNDLSFGARVHFITAKDQPLENIARDLATTPILPLDGARPIDLTCGLFRNG
jgi:hypothetical protein